MKKVFGDKEMRMNNVSRILILVILIASIGIVSGEVLLLPDRKIDVENMNSWQNHNFAVIKNQKFVYENSPFVANEIVVATGDNNISIGVEDVSRTERTVLFNVSNGAETVLAPITLDGRQVEIVDIDEIKIRIGLIELWKGMDSGFLETEITVIRPNVTENE